MRAFVTGANGFLGSHLVDRLLAKGVEVHLLVRKSSNLQWLLGKKVHFHYGDVVGNLKGFQEGVKRSDWLFHLAGVLRARDSKSYYEVNTTGTANVLEATLKVNPQIKRVVVVTSIAAHGPNLNDHPATEEDECRPITDYGKSKRDAELVTLRHVDRLPVTIVRPPAIYGPRDEQVFQFFQMVRRGIALLPGWGRRIVNMAYVQDVVTGILLAAENPRAVGEIFFIADERNYDWEETADIIGRAVRRPRPMKIHLPKALVYGIAGVAEGVTWLTGSTFPLNLAYARNFMQRNWALDISKAKKVLGYHPQYPLPKGAEETANWYQDEGWF